jgi:predicted nucleotidyltransferase
MSQISSNIHIPHEQIADFCRRNQIRRLAFFGSVLRDDFGPESDVDVLVEFNPDARVGMITLAGMEIELGELLGRTVEMHTVKGLNPLFRDEVLEMAEAQYEQAY